MRQWAQEHPAMTKAIMLFLGWGPACWAGWRWPLGR
jgi:hypothetical protein